MYIYLHIYQWWLLIRRHRRLLFQTHCHTFNVSFLTARSTEVLDLLIGQEVIQDAVALLLQLRSNGIDGIIHHPPPFLPSHHAVVHLQLLALWQIGQGYLLGYLVMLKLDKINRGSPKMERSPKPEGFNTKSAEFLMISDIALFYRKPPYKGSLTYICTAIPSANNYMKISCWASSKEQGDLLQLTGYRMTLDFNIAKKHVLECGFFPS